MSKSKPTDKQLLADEQSLIGQIADVDTQILGLQRARQEFTRSLKLVRQQLRDRTIPKELQLTDHVIVQYLNRAEGVDVEAVREKLLTPELQKLVDTLGGTGRYPVAGGQVVLQNYTLVTYLPAD